VRDAAAVPVTGDVEAKDFPRVLCRHARRGVAPPGSAMSSAEFIAANVALNVSSANSANRFASAGLALRILILPGFPE
jgi:hypothetical protein